MQPSKDFKLDFNCPVDVKNMPKCDGGFSCQECHKKVFDYSDKSLADFEQAAQNNAEVSSCGIYKAYQVEGAFGDWREGATRVYRNTIRKATKKRRFALLLPIMALLLILLGCGSRQVYGMVVAPEHDRTMVEPQQNSPECGFGEE